MFGPRVSFRLNDLLDGQRLRRSASSLRDARPGLLLLGGGVIHGADPWYQLRAHACRCPAVNRPRKPVLTSQPPRGAASNPFQPTLLADVSQCGLSVHSVCHSHGFDPFDRQNRIHVVDGNAGSRNHVARVKSVAGLGYRARSRRAQIGELGDTPDRSLRREDFSGGWCVTRKFNSKFRAHVSTMSAQRAPRPRRRR